MKIQYDSVADALYIELRPLKPGTAECREISEDVTANLAPDGRLAGLEVLNASALLGDSPAKVVLELSPALVAKSS